MIKLKVTLTPKEYLISYLQYIFNIKIFKYSIFVYFVALLIIFTIDEINRPHDLFFIELLITAIATLYYFLFFLIYIFLIFLSGVLIHIFINRSIFKKDIEYLVSQDFIQIKGKGYKSQIEWNVIKKLTENSYCIVLILKTSRFSLLIIPKRAFKNKEEQDMFINFFNKKQTHFKWTKS